MKYIISVDIHVDIMEDNVIVETKALKEICDKLYVGKEHYPDDYLKVNSIKLKEMKPKF